MSYYMNYQSIQINTSIADESETIFPFFHEFMMLFSKVKHDNNTLGCTNDITNACSKFVGKQKVISRRTLLFK